MAVSRYSGASTRKRPPEDASVWGRPRRLVGYCNSTKRVPSGVFTASMIVPAIMTTLPTYASGFDASLAYESWLFGILRGGDFLSKQRVTVHAKARSRPEVASHTKYSRCQPL